MSNDLTGFKTSSDEDLAHRVSYAYNNTKRQYNEYPPKADLVPIAEAINIWTLVCGCYMGIEQTMKLLIRIRGSKPPREHDLECLYSLLDPEDRNLVAIYYRVYRSLHNFDSGSIALNTSDEFIQHIGKGYVAWRYILVEGPDPEKVPRVHLGSMLETWRALVDLVELRVSGGNSYRTVATLLEQDYIMGKVCRDAESDDEWQAASQDENSGVEFKELIDWFQHRGRFLEEGIDLFNHHARGTGDSIQASPLLRRVLLRAADRAVQQAEQVPLGSPEKQAFGFLRWDDIIMFHRRIRSGGLAWNADKGVFE